MKFSEFWTHLQGISNQHLWKPCSDEKKIATPQATPTSVGPLKQRCSFNFVVDSMPSGEDLSNTYNRNRDCCIVAFVFLITRTRSMVLQAEFQFKLGVSWLYICQKLGRLLAVALNCVYCANSHAIWLCCKTFIWKYIASLYHGFTHVKMQKEIDLKVLTKRRAFHCMD